MDVAPTFLNKTTWCYKLKPGIPSHTSSVSLSGQSMATHHGSMPRCQIFGTVRKLWDRTVSLITMLFDLCLCFPHFLLYSVVQCEIQTSNDCWQSPAPSDLMGC